MLLARLLKTDRQHQPKGSFDGVVGDGYLLKHNYIYRNLRQAALARGYSFVESWPGYSSMSLSQLDRIVKERVIPMNFNGRILRKLNSDVRFRVNEIPGPIVSYHLHETAHCVADSLLQSVNTATPRQTLVKIFMGEGFANASESLASAIAESEDHRQFISMSSYILDTETSRKLKKRVLRLVGVRNTFFLMFYSYLYSNFLYESFSKKFVNGITAELMPGVKFTRKQNADFFDLMSIALELNLDFRTRTNSFYIRNLGFRGNLLKLLDFDVYRYIMTHEPWLAAVHELADIIEFGESAKSS